MKQSNVTLISVIFFLIIIVSGGIYLYVGVNIWEQKMKVFDVQEQKGQVDGGGEVKGKEGYVPSKELNDALDVVVNDLRMSLFRGDAELAPSYEEFVNNVIKAEGELESVVYIYEKESKGKEVALEVKNVFDNLGKIDDKLKMSLFRGDAELAPSYSEYVKTVIGINDELLKVVDEYDNLSVVKNVFVKTEDLEAVKGK